MAFRVNDRSQAVPLIHMWWVGTSSVDLSPIQREIMDNQNNTEKQAEADRVSADLAANAAKAHWHESNDRAALIRQINQPRETQ